MAAFAGYFTWLWRTDTSPPLCGGHASLASEGLAWAMLGGLQFGHCTEWCRAGTLGESTEGFAINCLHQSLKDGRCSTQPKWHPIIVLTQAPLGWWTLSYGLFVWFYLYLVDCIRVIKSSQPPAKIAAYLVSVGQLLCLVFLYRLCCWNEIFVDWPLTLTTQPSTSKLSDNPTVYWWQVNVWKVWCHAKCIKFVIYPRQEIHVFPSLHEKG